MSEGCVVWLTGRPSSGKSTIGRALVEVLRHRGRATCLLDGDEVRGALVPTPGYGPGERDAFYATLANLAALVARQGVVVVVAATAHRRVYREGARAAAPRFVEVFVRSAPAVCGARDSKGLYAKARAGEVAGLPGSDLAFEEPESPELVVDGEGIAEHAANHIALAVAPLE